MFKPGIEVFFNQAHAEKNTPIAITANFTSKNRNGQHLISLLKDSPSFKLKKIFTPEHGFYSDAPDGEHVKNSYIDGVEVISLYQEQKKPSAEALKGIEAIIYDIQDLGVRFYTYISTLANVLEAANECGTRVIVLDRPNLLGLNIVEGPMRQNGFESFVGQLEIPLRYGLTAGELAKWLHFKNNYTNELKVYFCENYKCPVEFEDLNIEWVKPSPSMPSIESALFYPGTCLFEGTNISEGRGTEAPFCTLGAPFINAKVWLKELLPLLPRGVEAKQTEFTPTFGKFANELCFGIRLKTKKIIKNAVYVGLSLLSALIKTHPRGLVFTKRPNLKHPFIDYLAGTNALRLALLKQTPPKQIADELNQTALSFAKEREQFFLYERL